VRLPPLTAALICFAWSAAGAACDPAAWDETDRAWWTEVRAGRGLSTGDRDAGAFVSRVLGCPALAGELPAAGLVLSGVRLDSLTVERETIAARFECRDCRFGTIRSAGATWARDLDLAGSTIDAGAGFAQAEVKGALNAREVRARGGPDGATIDLAGARVARDLWLDGARAAGLVSLRDAAIGGDLSARGLRTLEIDIGEAAIGGDLDLSGALSMASPVLVRTEVGGAALLSDLLTPAVIDAAEIAVGGPMRLDGAAAEAISLHDARIGGHLSLNGVHLDGAAALDKARIGGDLWMRRMDGGPRPEIGVWLAPQESALSLANASIGGRIDIEDADIAAGVNLDAVRVGEDLWLRGGSRVGGKIDAVFARFGQNIDFSGAELGCVDATGARIDGELRLGRPGDGPRSAPPSWRPDARLVLRNATAAAWVDAHGASCMAASSWPDTIDIAGFDFARVGGLGGGAETLRERCGAYLDLLRRQEPFSLDPYRRLADYLDAGGAAAAAREVRWAAKERQLAHAWEHGETLDAAALIAQRLFVGYGIYEHHVLGWIVGMILLGALVFPRAPEARSSPIPLGLLYSFDMLLPFVSFRDAHDKVDFESPFRYYLYFHKFMGWVFALFFASALGGLFAV
jgi:hypothetical protein